MKQEDKKTSMKTHNKRQQNIPSKSSEHVDKVALTTLSFLLSNLEMLASSLYSHLKLTSYPWGMVPGLTSRSASPTVSSGTSLGLGKTYQVLFWIRDFFGILNDLPFPLFWCWAFFLVILLLHHPLSNTTVTFEENVNNFGTICSFITHKHE